MIEVPTYILLDTFVLNHINCSNIFHSPSPIGILTRIRSGVGGAAYGVATLIDNMMRINSSTGSDSKGES